MDYCISCGARLSPSARFCAACGEPADTELTRLASEETRIASEETRVAPGRPSAPQPVRPLPVRPQPAAAPPAPQQRAAAAADEIEKVVFSLRPTLLFVKAGYALAALGGILLVALIALVGARFGVDIPLFVTIPLALALLLIPAYHHFKRNTVRYTLTDSKIEIDQGFVSRTTRNIPLRNIQDVTVTSTVLQRILRFGNVVVDNASEEGGVTVMRNIPDPRRHADILLRELRRWR